MTIYDHTGKIAEKKFYHSEWKLTDLLKARNDGLLTDEGEAWKYRYSHMDGTGGKYDLLFRREPTAIEAPVQEPLRIPSVMQHVPTFVSDRAAAPPHWLTAPDETAALRAKLAEVERAAYERGVRDAAAQVADTCPHADVPGGNCTPDTFDEGTSAAYEAILVLLTQEVR